MKMIQVSEDALNTLKAMAEQDAKDAALYRWLRDSATAYLWYETNWTKYDLPEKFDSAIYAAMQTK